jgi:membrane protease YdiL (CAAX protease family)
MTLFDDNPLSPPEQNPGATLSDNQSAESPSPDPLAPLLPGDPISYVAANPAAAHPADSRLPEDLRIPWSWVHLLVFVIYVLVTQFAIATVVIGYYSVYRHVPQKQLKHLLESDPKVLVVTTILMFALIFLFLYVTLAALRNMPFWRTLGWRKLKADPTTGKSRPWVYFLSGCGLSIFVALASSRVKDAENAPIQEFFKSRNGAMLLMAMAVFVAPLVEETIFRGYLYPTLARIISVLSRFIAADSARAGRVSVLTSAIVMATNYGVFRSGRLALTWGVFSLLTLFGIILLVILIIGNDSARADRAGVFSSIILTGVLFGLVHAPQLGKNWALVSLLILVGVIFTFARAWTGTVLASFLLHLGYNSMIAVTSIIATKGFTHMPPHP